MTLTSWINRFWRRAYGRRPREVRAPDIKPSNARAIVLDDMGEIVVVILTEDNHGNRQVWREVKP